MLAMLIGVLSLVLIYRALKSGSQYEIDWWMALVFVLVPGMLVALLSGLLWLLEWPSELILVGYSLYFVVPFFILKTGLDFQAKTAAKFAAFVPVVMVAATLVVSMMLAAVPA